MPLVVGTTEDENVIFARIRYTIPFLVSLSNHERVFRPFDKLRANGKQRRFSEQGHIGFAFCIPWLLDYLSVKAKREGGAIAPPVWFFRSPKATSVRIINQYLASAH
jgi:hypothetical protein